VNKVRKQRFFTVITGIFLVLAFILVVVPATTLWARETGTAVSRDAAPLENDDDFDDFDDEDEEFVTIADPLEPINRGIFWFNDKLYFYLIKPVTRVYRIVPEGARISVSNFFSNIFTPIRFANALVQLKFRDAGTELGRLLINSTIGIGGLFDPAKNIYRIRKKSEDFGQTLGHYGVGQGFYLVLPVIGPTSLRDGLGLAVDSYYLNPIYTLDLKDRDKYTLVVLDKINALSLDKDTYEAIKKESLDPYLFVRDAYSQNREGKVNK